MPGRNAAQLRADAIATGLYDGPRRNYVGDGYSIPWEVANYQSVPFGFTMYAYKLYLDARWPEFSRLHDWLYTPYGAIIGATQEEADDALQEELQGVSPPDAIVVGNACRYFGAIYWGKSQVGYHGEQGTRFGNNIGLTPPTTLKETNVLMATKIVILFSQTTTRPESQPAVNFAGKQRTGGWSESFYGPDSIESVITLLKGPAAPGQFPVLQARANLLGNSASIVGVRLYQGGAGKGQLLNLAYNGNNGASDQPGLSVLFSATSNTTGQSRRWLTCGWADSDCEGGEWTPDPDTVNRVQQYFAAIGGAGWLAQTNNSQVNIFSIAANGAVTTLAPVAFAVGNVVTIKNTTLTATGQRVGGKYVVSAIGPLNTNFTIAGWPTFASTGGTAGIVGAAFQAFSGCTLSAVRTTFRKIGRPFDGYRGKKSRRRATA